MTHPDVPGDTARFEAVSFLSDYGHSDESVGVITAVISDMAPHANVIHLTHDIAPFDVRAGSLALARAVAYLPAGVVLAIVDPCGPFRRRPVAIEVAGGAGVFVGPDNGLLAPAVAMAGGAERAVHLDNPDYQLIDAAAAPHSRGRDIYAPAVAALLNGADLSELGTTIDPGELLPGTIPLPRTEGDTIIGEVLSIDRFGNVQLNIGPEELPAAWGDRFQIRLPALDASINIGAEAVRTVYRTIPRTVPRTVSQAAPSGSSPEAGATDSRAGALVMYDDSHGMVSLSMDERSAAAELGVATGERVVLTMITDAQRSPEPGAPHIQRVEFGQRPRPS